ncbi:MAG: thioredoxin family protein [Pedobacter sp.]|nr:MAG: thioredoxin family protein [Pedobacter sp.]
MSNYSNYFQAGLSYPVYKQLIVDLLAAQKTTGQDHSEFMLHYSKMNLQRMNRVEKTTELLPELSTYLKSFNKPLNFLVITEGWCGDAAQIVPVIQKMVEVNPQLFNLRCVLRDENLELIDAHLTNGGRAIPVLLLLDEEGDLIGEKWGPRPAILQDLLNTWKTEGVVMPELAEKIHAWYAKDKTVATQQSLLNHMQKVI